MRFADKLFLAMTALLTLMFALFGTWMLSADFSQLLDKEIEQGNNDIRTFHYLFEMGYQSTEEFGEDYAISKTLSSIVASVERDGRHMFVIRENGERFYGGDYLENMGFTDVLDSLIMTLEAPGSTGYSSRNIAVRQIGSTYYLFAVTMSGVAESNVYLAMCRDLTEIYDARSSLLSRYRIALLCLLSAGGIWVYFLSRYITRPIRSLGRMASRIADGDYILRSQNKSRDEIGELARDFNRMADRLVEEMQVKVLEAKQKEDFTAAFAHELKTPLTSIIGYADMLNSLELTEEERHDAYFYIYSQGKRLESLSHKLLELVSMDKNPLTFRTVSTKQLEQNLRITMRPIWKQRGVRGRVNLEKAIIQGDAELLLSLLYNLMDNAVKALDKGNLSFMLMKGVCLTGAYEIKVVDNGRGIPAEEISRITEAFYMVDKSRSRKEGGAGIGMALCQKIIQLHKGTMEVESRLGEGTVIKITFPRKESSVKGEGYGG